MFSSILPRSKKARKQQPQKPKAQSPPASPASFYSPGIQPVEDSPPPPVPPVDISPTAAFPYATRFPWSPGRDQQRDPSSKTVHSGALSPGIQLNLDFQNESLFDDLPPAMFHKSPNLSRSSLAPSSRKSGVPSHAKTPSLPTRSRSDLVAPPPIKIPATVVPSRTFATPQPTNAKPQVPAPVPAPAPAPAPAPVPAIDPPFPTVPTPFSSSGSDSDSSFYSDYSEYGYVSAPDLDWHMSPGGASNSSTHRPRQDSATLPFDPDREALFASLSRRGSEHRLHRNSSRHSRRASRKANSRPGSSRMGGSRPGSMADTLVSNHRDTLPSARIGRASRVSSTMYRDRSRSRSRHRKSNGAYRSPSFPSTPVPATPNILSPALSHAQARSYSVGRISEGSSSAGGSRSPAKKDEVVVLEAQREDDDEDDDDDGDDEEDALLFEEVMLDAYLEGFDPSSPPPPVSPAPMRLPPRTVSIKRGSAAVRRRPPSNLAHKEHSPNQGGSPRAEAMNGQANGRMTNGVNGRSTTNRQVNGTRVDSQINGQSMHELVNGRTMSGQHSGQTLNGGQPMNGQHGGQTMNGQVNGQMANGQVSVKSPRNDLRREISARPLPNSPTPPPRVPETSSHPSPSSPWRQPLQSASQSPNTPSPSRMRPRSPTRRSPPAQNPEFASTSSSLAATPTQPIAVPRRRSGERTQASPHIPANTPSASSLSLSTTYVNSWERDDSVMVNGKSPSPAGRFAHPQRPGHAFVRPVAESQYPTSESPSTRGNPAGWDTKRDNSSGDLQTPLSGMGFPASGIPLAQALPPSGSGAGVRRVSIDHTGISAAPPNRLSALNRMGALPIGSKPTAMPMLDRFQLRQRSGSESAIQSPSGPAFFNTTSDAGRSNNDGRSTTTRRGGTEPPASFPETPTEFSPILTPSSSSGNLSTEPAVAPSSTQAIVSIPTRLMMPKPPIIEPAPPPRRDRPGRPPLPVGPRKPSVKAVVPPAQRSASSQGMTVGTPASATQTPVSRSTPTHVPTSATTPSPTTSPVPGSPKFQTQPVQWKGLTMDAAKWTFTSQQLQDIVGRAIRQSAEASSVRLLTLDVLDHQLPAEIRRLEGTLEEIKSKYRAAVRRRKVLLKSLTKYVEEGNHQARTRMLQELMELSTTCDGLSEELFRVMDELQQIQRLRDVHSASALAMALRKLNSSFVKQSADMAELKMQRTELEEERNEAWALAERIENDLLDLQAKLDPAPTSFMASNRSSRVSAARKTSLRASKASLRFSRVIVRSARSSMSSNRLSTAVLAPPVPPMPPLPTSQQLSLNTDLAPPIPSPYSIALSSPSSEQRELEQVQDELYRMLGLTRADSRYTLYSTGRNQQRPLSELVFGQTSMPTSPYPPTATSSEGFRPISEALSPQGTLRRRGTSFSELRSLQEVPA